MRRKLPRVIRAIAAMACASVKSSGSRVCPSFCQWRSRTNCSSSSARGRYSFLWSDDETLFLEVQPETGWIEVYSTGPDLVEEVRSDTKWEVVPLTRDLPQS